jgi:hypothetical protein
MTYTKAIMAITPLFILCNCGAPTETVEQTAAIESLEGSWRRISVKNQETGEWTTDPGTRIYEKYISPTHFCWISYETEQDSLLGTGGGTYVYDNQASTYTEDISFFLPVGSQLLGQTIPFDVSFEDGKWYHTGFAKAFEFDPETGENVVTDSSKIEEIWELIDNHPSQEGLVGTWQLESYRGEDDSIRSDYPDFVSYVKLITPTHFVWVHYLNEQDQVLAEGGGTYIYDGNTYTETLKFVYPSGSGQIGTVLPFHCKLEGDTWYHTGHIIIQEKDDTGKMTPSDSVKIDEVWKPFQSQS